MQPRHDVRNLGSFGVDSGSERRLSAQSTRRRQDLVARAAGRWEECTVSVTV